MSNPVQRVLDAAVEGQARSARHIQKQLSKLHATLTKEGAAIRSAISSESKQSTAEVEVQYALALEAVAACFADSNFEKALRAEFSLSRSENAPSNSVPYSVAYIVPSTYNVVYSCVSAVTAAISAGSCVILEVRSNAEAFQD
jgi:acyl-CoA reductase-like NAD-dependent aldehyde dehydrogenase